MDPSSQVAKSISPVVALAIPPKFTFANAVFVASVLAVEPPPPPLPPPGSYKAPATKAAADRYPHSVQYCLTGLHPSLVALIL